MPRTPGHVCRLQGRTHQAARATLLPAFQPPRNLLSRTHCSNTLAKQLGREDISGDAAAAAPATAAAEVSTGGCCQPGQ